MEIEAEDVGGTSLANAREHRVLAGRVVRKQLSFPERAIVLALHVPEGDFRDWTEVRQWAAGIASALGAGFSPQARQGGDHTG